MIYLGIDTSNYKTSVAAVDENGKTAAAVSEFLEVPEGSRGLRQSEAFFRHSNRLPEYLEKIFRDVDACDIAAIGVSERPRRIEGSYMPCFLAGINAARITASSLDVPLYTFSHQEGHAAAVLPETADDVIFMHLSGGTTEFLLCRPDDEGYDMEIIGGTRDISIGQLIDRYGVASGLPFPSGRYMDEQAFGIFDAAGFDPKHADLPDVMPVIRVKDGYFNLSGAETRLMRYKGESEPATAALFLSISTLLCEAAAGLSDRYGIKNVWMAGGVASSRTIRELINRSNACGSVNIFFGEAALSGDNAVGTARLAAGKHRRDNISQR